MDQDTWTNVGMLGYLFFFSVRFYTDFIGALESLGWLIRGWSEFCPLGLSRGFFFLFLRCEIGNFVGFADFGLWFWGDVCGGMVLDLVPSLWGDIDLRVRA